MIDSPMAEGKRDYWGTIFNVVMGDENSGEKSLIFVFQSQLYGLSFL